MPFPRWLAYFFICSLWPPVADSVSARLIGSVCFVVQRVRNSIVCPICLQCADPLRCYSCAVSLRRWTVRGGRRGVGRRRSAGPPRQAEAGIVLLDQECSAQTRRCGRMRGKQLRVQVGRGWRRCGCRCCHRRICARADGVWRRATQADEGVQSSGSTTAVWTMRGETSKRQRARPDQLQVPNHSTALHLPLRSSAAKRLAQRRLTHAPHVVCFAVAQ